MSFQYNVKSIVAYVEVLEQFFLKAHLLVN